jgi:hypothetical protein
MRIMDQGGKHWSEAETILREILSECPDYPEAKFQLARLWTGEMRNSYYIRVTFTNEVTTHSIEDVYHTVDRLLQDVIQSEPNHPGPYYCFACWACFPLKKSYSAMEKFYREGLLRDGEVDPQYYIFHDDVGMAASEANDRELAVEAFYWAQKSGKETGDTHPGIEPAYTFWKSARSRLIRENPDLAGQYDSIGPNGEYKFLEWWEI